MELTVTGLSVGENNDLVMLGKMGVWEAKIYFGPSEMKQVMRLAVSKAEGPAGPSNVVDERLPADELRAVGVRNHGKPPSEQPRPVGVVGLPSGESPGRQLLRCGIPGFG